MQLINAVKRDNRPEVLRLLEPGAKTSFFKKPVDVHEVDLEYKGSALYWAAGCGHQHFLEPLLNAGIGIDTPDKHGATPLYFAAQNGHTGIVQELVAALGASHSAPKNNGATPLFIAAQFGRTSTVQALVDLGANPDTATNDGRTPVFVTAREGHLNTLKALLDAGADASIETPMGTALEQARKGKKAEHPAIVALLEAHLKEYPKGIKPVVPPIRMQLINAVKQNKETEVLRFLEPDAKTSDDRPLNIHEVDPEYQGTALYWAAKNGHDRLITPLSKAGIGIHKPDKDGRTPLYIAAREGHTVTVQVLATLGASVSATSKSGYTPLCVAAWGGRTDTVQALAALGASVSTSNNDGCTPVYVAAENGYTATVKALVSTLGANHSTRNKDDCTPVYGAAEKGRTATVKALVILGANHSTPNKDGWTPVYVAASNGHIATVQALVTLGANHSTLTKNGCTPVYGAAYNGHTAAVQALVTTLGANHSTPNKDGYTPLCAAAWGGHTATVQALVVLGASPDTATNDGRTPLYAAAENGHLETVRALLDAGADASIKTPSGTTALEQARKGTKAGHPAIVTLLKAHFRKYPNGINPVKMQLIDAVKQNNETEVLRLLQPGAKTSDGKPVNIHEVDPEYQGTALYWAAKNGHEHLIQPLINAGIGIHKPDKDGRTPLYIAAREGHTTTMQTLAARGANISTPNKSGYTPLCSAACDGRTATVQALAALGASVSTPNSNGETPVYCAAENGHTATVQALADLWANHSTPQNDGTTPVFIAAQNGYTATVQALVALGASPSTAKNNGATPLVVAAENGHLYTVTALLDAGADASIKTTKWGTALDLAKQGTKARHPAIVALLEDHLKKYPDGIKPPLINAVKQNKKKEVLRLLKPGATTSDGKPVNIHEVDPEYQGTALYWAAKNGHEHLIRPLVKAGIDIHKPDRDGGTPLYIAAQEGHTSTMRTLAVLGASLSTARNDGWTPLCVAASNGHTATVQALAALEVSPNTATKNGWTPLCAAAWNGHLDTVKALLDARADASIETRWGTALEQAKNGGHSAIVTLLEAHFELYPNGVKPVASLKNLSASAKSSGPQTEIATRSIPELVVASRPEQPEHQSARIQLQKALLTTKKLEFLDLKPTEADLECIAELASSGVTPLCVQHLKIEHTPLGDEGVIAIFPLLHSCSATLTTLSFADNQLTDVFISAFIKAKLLSLEALSGLILSQNNFSEEKCARLKQLCVEKDITLSLDPPTAPLGSSGTTQLSSIPENASSGSGERVSTYLETIDLDRLEQPWDDSMSIGESVNSDACLTFNSDNNVLRISQALQRLLLNLHDELSIEADKTELNIRWHKSMHPDKDALVIGTLQRLFGTDCQLNQADKKIHLEACLFRDIHVQTFTTTKLRVKNELLEVALREAQGGNAQLTPMLPMFQEILERSRNSDIRGETVVKILMAGPCP